MSEDLEDVADPAEPGAVEESEDVGRRRRVVRRIAKTPTPQSLKKARDVRLKEALLANSKDVREALVTWDGTEQLSVPVEVASTFDGRLLAAYYRGHGWESCRLEGGDVDQHLVFEPSDMVSDEPMDEDDDAEGGD